MNFLLLTGTVSSGTPVCVINSSFSCCLWTKCLKNCCRQGIKKCWDMIHRIFCNVPEIIVFLWWKWNSSNSCSWEEGQEGPAVGSDCQKIFFIEQIVWEARTDLESLMGLTVLMRHICCRYCTFQRLWGNVLYSHWRLQWFFYHFILWVYWAFEEKGHCK